MIHLSLLNVNFMTLCCALLLQNDTLTINISHFVGTEGKEAGSDERVDKDEYDGMHIHLFIYKNYSCKVLAHVDLEI